MEKKLRIIFDKELPSGIVHFGYNETWCPRDHLTLSVFNHKFQWMMFPVIYNHLY